MNVLSLFDGISAGQVALNRLGIKYDNYYASEIDKYAIQITQKNYPKTIQLGDITKVNGYDLPKIDLILAGPPCQDLSIAKKNRQGLDGSRSGLFWEFVRILKEVKPANFLVENVASMSIDDCKIMSAALGVLPVKINSSLLSAQNRKRYYFTNIKGDGDMFGSIGQPKDKGILLKDILESGYVNVDKTIHPITASYYKAGKANFKERKGHRRQGVSTVRIGQLGKGGQGDRVYSIDGKSVSLSANGGGRGAKTGLYQIPHGFMKESYKKVDKYPTLCGQNPDTKYKIEDSNCIRKLTPIECERLQTFDDNYTKGISNSQRYKVIGNSWTVDVICHILKGLKEAN